MSAFNKMSSHYRVFALLIGIAVGLFFVVPKPKAACGGTCGGASVTIGEGTPSITYKDPCAGPVPKPYEAGPCGKIKVRLDARAKACDGVDVYGAFSTSNNQLAKQTDSGPGWAEYEVSAPEPYEPTTITFTAHIDVPVLEFDENMECIQTDVAPDTAVGTLKFVPEGESGCACNDNPFSTADCNVASVDFRLHLGASSATKGAGFIWLKAKQPIADLASPTALALPFDRATTERLPASGPIQQIKTSEGLVKINVENSQKYHLLCYYNQNVSATKDASGFYTTTGTECAKWTVETPDTTSPPTHLWVTETRGSQQRQFQYSYNSVNSRWDLLLPNGQTKSAWEMVDSMNSDIFNHFYETSAGGITVRKSQTVYEYVPALQQTFKKQEIKGSGTTQETTSYTYYTSGSTAGLVQRIDYPDGQWSYFTYDSKRREVKHYSTYGNYPPPTSGEPNFSNGDRFRLTETFYTLSNSEDGYEDNGDPHSSTQWRKKLVSMPVDTGGGALQLKPIAKQYQLTDIANGYNQLVVCENVNAYLYDANNQVTTTSRETGADTLGRVTSVTRPDGTSTSYSYTETSGGGLSTVESDGDGTQRQTELDNWGRVLLRKTTSPGGVVLSHKTYQYTDTARRSYIETDELTGRNHEYQYACCGLESEIDADGAARLYDYDELKRKVSTSQYWGGSAYVKIDDILDAAGNVLVQNRIGSDASGAGTVQLAAYSYDTLGRQIRYTNALGGVTTNLYLSNSYGKREVTLYPTGGTLTNDYYRDGRLWKVTGTAVSGVLYEYGAENQASSGDDWHQYVKETKLNDANNWVITSEWVKRYSDAAGRVYKTEYADANAPYPYEKVWYNPQGKIWKQRDADGNFTLLSFDADGHPEYVIKTVVPAATIYEGSYDELEFSTFSPARHLAAVDANGKSDRITRTVHSVIALDVDDPDSKPDRTQTEIYVWDQDQDANAKLVAQEEVAASGLKSWRTVYPSQSNPQTTSVETTYGANGSRTVLTTMPDNSASLDTYAYGRRSGRSKLDSNGQPIQSETYAYDKYNRLTSVTDSRNGTTTYQFNAADQQTVMTTPAVPVAQTTVNYYDKMGRKTGVQNPDGATVTNFYSAKGLVTKTYGSRLYPVEYTYDYAGRMKTLKTWQTFNYQSGSGSSGAATTTWYYDAYRGQLVKKVYQGETDTTADYEYLPSGRLWKRNWERGITTTYGYNTVGELASISYSDTTPGVAYTYDRLGRKKTVTQTGGTTTYEYNDAGQITSETTAGGLLDGVVVSRAYDPAGYLEFLTAERGLQGYTINYGYDEAGRMKDIGWGNLSGAPYKASYGYHAQSSLLNTVTFTASGMTRLVTTKSYDALNRLTSIASTANSQSQPFASFGYQYNDANQRTRADLEDGTHWEYNYDARGQVLSGKRFWADGSFVAGQQFEYAYDEIGNRKTTGAGGDASGGALRSSTYTPTLTNTYYSRTVPGAVDILGIANPTASVTVNGTAATRKGEYYHLPLTVANTSAPQYPTVTVASTYSPGQSQSGNVFVPKTPETYTYDQDGNLTQDGRWVYTWDAENRLVKMESRTGAPTGSKLKLEFAYDAEGRRIWKKVTSLDTSTVLSESKFIYDRWNLIANLDASFNFVHGYVWGLDLSRSMQSAGGVGGLLWIAEFAGGSVANCHYAAYDGNGNVVGLVRATDGATTAKYEYGPFGEPIQVTGGYAAPNPFRFSTKYTDSESGVIYYGFRSYNPSTGKWLNRDLIGEEGGLNLYGFVCNTPINAFDPLGDKHFKFHETVTTPTYTYTDSRGIPHSRGGDSVGATIEFDLSYTCNNGRVDNVTYGGFQGNIDGLIGSWPGNEFTFGFGFFEIYERHSFSDTTVEKNLPSPACCEKRLFTVKVKWRTKAGIDYTPSIGPISPFPSIPGPVLVDKPIAEFSYPLLLSCCR